MRKRFLTMLLGLGLVLSMFVWALGSASADHTGTQEVYFPWIPNGAELTGQTDEFDGNTGLWYGTVTVQNLEDTEIEVDFYVGNPGNGFDFSSTWAVGAYASVTLSAADLGGSGDGFAVKAHGFVQREITEEQTGDDGETETVVVQEEIRAHITGAAKNVSNQSTDTGKTNSGHIAVDGYSAMTENQVGGGTHVLPITQLNNNWNTHIRLARFDDSGAGQQVTITFYDAFGSGQSGGSAGTFQVGLTPGEVETIDLSQVPGLDEDFTGSAWISAGSATVGAVAERIKQEDSMLLINTSRPSAEANGVKYAPLVFQNYNMWNTGISVANLSDSTNTVTINFHGPTSHGQISRTLQIAPRAMEFIFIPGLQEIGLDDDGFVGSAILISESGQPFHAAVDQVKYFGSGLDVGHAMSYIAEHDTAGDGDPQHAVNDALALPIFSKGNNAGEGDTSGIQLFNASPEHSVNAHIYFYDQSGARVEPTVNNPRSVSLAPRESHTVYALHLPTMPENFWGSAIIQVSGEGELVAVSNNVNYSVQNDGSATFNLIRVPGEPQEPTATRATVSPVSDTNIWGDTHELTVTVYDQFDEPMEGVFVNANITEGPHVNYSEAGDVMSGTTGDNGQVILSYTGGNIHHGLSQDTITIDVDGISGPLTATKTWVFGDPTTIELTHEDGTTDPAINVIYFEPHTVTATVRDQNNNLLPGAEVTFNVNASDAGLQRLFLTSDVVTTNNQGEASFEYVAQYPGLDPAYADVITASVNGITSNEVVKVWRNLVLTLEHVDDPVDPPNVTYVSEHTVVATLTAPAFNFVSGPAVGVSAPAAPVEGADINFSTDEFSANDVSGSDTTDVNGEAFFTYMGENAGDDTIIAALDVDEANYNDSVTKTWHQLLVQLDHAEGYSPVNPVNTYHRVVATLGFDTGGGFTSLVDGGIAGSYSGIQVNFEVDGVNLVDSTPRFTNGDGEATFTYFGAGGIGEDTITATLAVNGESDDITKIWDDYTVTLTMGEGESTQNYIFIEDHTVVAQVTDANNDPVEGVVVTFVIQSTHEGLADIGETGLTFGDPGLGELDWNQGYTDADGYVSFTYTGELVGHDHIYARIDFGTGFRQSLSQHKEWIGLELQLEHVGDALNRDGEDHMVVASLTAAGPYSAPVPGFEDQVVFTINGQPVSDFDPDFETENLGNGQTSMTYSFAGGVTEAPYPSHVIVATLQNGAGEDTPIVSNSVEKQWYAPVPNELAFTNLVLQHTVDVNGDQWEAYDVRVEIYDQEGILLEDEWVHLQITDLDPDVAADLSGAAFLVGGAPTTGVIQVNTGTDGTEGEFTIAIDPSDPNINLLAGDIDVTVTGTSDTDPTVTGTHTVTFEDIPRFVAEVVLTSDPPAGSPARTTGHTFDLFAEVFDQHGQPIENILVTFIMEEGWTTGFGNNVGLHQVGQFATFSPEVDKSTDGDNMAHIQASRGLFTPAPREATVYAIADGVRSDDPDDVDMLELEWVQLPSGLIVWHTDTPFTTEVYNASGDPHSVSAYLFDQDGFPVQNADVNFNATNGTSLDSGARNTGGNGIAVWDDYVRVVVDDVEDTVTASHDFTHPIDETPETATSVNSVIKHWVNWTFELEPVSDTNPVFSAQQINTVLELIELQLGEDATQDEIDEAVEEHWLEFLGESAPNQHTIVGTVYTSGGVEIELTEDNLATLEFDFGGSGTVSTAIVDGEVHFTINQSVPSVNNIFDPEITVNGVLVEGNNATKTWILFEEWEYDPEVTFLTLVHPPGQDPVNPAGTDHTVLATLYDQFGIGFSGQNVRFQMTGDSANPTPASFGWYAPDGVPAGIQPGNVGPTDSNGQIAFNYVGPNVGVDTIVADWNNFALSASVQKEWVEPDWMIVGTTLAAGVDVEIDEIDLESSVRFRATIHAIDNPNLHPAPGNVSDGVNFQVCLLNQVVCVQPASNVAIDANGVATSGLVLVDIDGSGVILDLLQNMNLLQLLQLQSLLLALEGNDLIVLEIVANAVVDGQSIESDSWDLTVLDLSVSDLLGEVGDLIDDLLGL